MLNQSKTKSESPRYSGRVVYGRLLHYMLPYIGIFLLSTLGYLLFMLSRAGAVKLMERIQVWLQDPPEYVFYYLPAGVIVLFLLQGIGSLVGGYFLSAVSVRLVERLRGDLVDNLLNLSVGRLRSLLSGNLVSQITYTASQVTSAGVEAVRVLLRDGFTTLGLMAYLFYLNWKLTLVLLMLAPLIAVVVGSVSKMFRRYSSNIQQSMGDLTQVTSEMIKNFHIVKSLGAEEQESTRFEKHNAYNRKQQLKVALVKWISTPMVQLLIAIGLGVQLGIMGYQILHDKLAPEVFMAYLTAAALLASPMRHLTTVNSSIQQGIAAAQNIFSQLDEPAEQNQGDHKVDCVKGKIEFRNLCFSYKGSKTDKKEPLQIFTDFNLCIEPGEVVALVGPSGAGKTTLSQFLLRFLEPDSGSVLLDDVALPDYDLACLRQQVGVVDQRVTLFNDTVYNNLCYGVLRQREPEQVRQALKIAGADEFVYALPNGMQTVVGEDGMLLSGGQRQRLALARGLLEAAPVLILDEATSSLDSLSERLIQEGLEELVRGRTTIIIAHRLSTIERADRILVLKEGSIVESGTHEELLEQDGFYTELYQNQFRSERKQSETKVEPYEPAEIEPLRATAPVSTSRDSIQRMWHTRSWVSSLLSPVAKFNEVRARKGHQKFINGGVKSWKAPVPVIVVGNITVGGTGKTPVVSWLAEQLVKLGYRPGIVSRGYVPSAASRAPYYPFRVQRDSNPHEVGDEAVMLARQTEVPVCVGPDRPAAVRALLDECDVILSDDGLQHHALGRDIELVVVDGVRGFGNGLCLPAGPLREPVDRLDSADWILCNGVVPLTGNDTEICFHLAPVEWVHLLSGETRAIADWVDVGRAHCVAGLGNPERFFNSVQGLGIEVLKHPFPDHHQYRDGDLVFDDELPIITTEKDAVKWDAWVNERMWVLRVQPQGLEPILKYIQNKLAQFEHKV